MSERRAEWLSPQAYREALAACPLALVPWGAFEWHGPHCPLGLDGVKAHALALRIAEAVGGGVVLPPFYVGHRTLKNARGFPLCIECRPATVMALAHDVLAALDEHGARVIVLVPGHYGQTHRAVLSLAVESWLKERGAGAPAVWQASDYELGRQDPEHAQWDSGDHAGMWETSLSMALLPDQIHLEALDERPEGALREDQGVLGRDPRRHASRALGERLVEAIVRRAREKILALLQGA